MVYPKVLHIAGSILFVLMLSIFSNSENKIQFMQKQDLKTTEGASVYQQGFKKFKYYIESIGTVSIDEVALKNENLTAIYSYKLGSETRHVVSALTLDSDNIYKGTCTTKVNGRVLFAVNTWLTFKADGTAIGNWSWSGSPSKNDPIVKISKL